MTSERTSELCAEIDDRMAEILDGTAGDRILDHLAECDRCRDARHDAERARGLVLSASADYRSPADLEQRVLGGLAPEKAERADDSPEARAPNAAPKAAETQKALEPRRLWAIFGGLALAAATALVIRGGKDESPAGKDGGGWRGTIARVAGAGGQSRLELCDPRGKSCSAVQASAGLPAGSVLRTDERTLAELQLSDGSTLILDRASELWLDGKNARSAKLVRGALVADISHRPGSAARIALGRGRIDVLGTKFALRAGTDFAVVDVSRGAVELCDDGGRSVQVRAGEEGRLYSGSPPHVSPKAALGEALLIGESSFGEGDREPPPRALGELRAKKPGQNDELSNAVTLTSHAVRVRISGAVARTEIDEVFTNLTDDVLEGVYRFPIPPDAKIEKLALEVDGKLENGAFVDRDRAAAIWRGAIVNAAPQARRQIQDEIVWVPGPWKDPALLEWQRGGRFELRIFPIPKRGSRRVVLAYTQLIQPSAGVRRYSYPLAHDPSGSTRVGEFSVDVQVRGHDAEFGVRPSGYELSKSRTEGAERLALSARQFVPSGDLSLEYALPDRDAELTAWAYRPTAESGSGSGPGSEASYVALTLRPRLPRVGENRERLVALVVDASRSMFGESYRRATAVAVRLVRELDAADRVTVLACDVECRTLPGGVQRPGPEAAAEVRRFLDGISPEGGSDVTASVHSALAAGARAGARAVEVVYIGDGTPTVGPIRPATVTRAVEEAALRNPGKVTTVAVGSDSDLDTLSALARGGGGTVVPYSPGQSAAQAAFAALGAVYAAALTNAELVLPDGLFEVAPHRLDNLAAGTETLIVARMNRAEVSGTALLRGKLGGKAFEQRYPLRVVASDAGGNAFVPRLFAGAKIAELERDGGAEAKKLAVELSTRFDVASRYTSLLVLESPAMFRAFGLDNTQSLPEWTGEEADEATSAEGEIAFDDRADIAPPSGAGMGVGRAASAAAGPPPAKKAKAEARRDELEARASAPAPTSTSAPLTIAESASVAPTDPLLQDLSRRRRMIPMRRIWERTGDVTTERLIPNAATISAVAEAERELAANENRRAAVKKLYALLAVSSDLERAAGVAERWSAKDPLDPDALTARADLEARRGRREEAIRILGSVVDVRPSDVAAQKRLARLHRWAGRPALGCRHSIAIAELHPGDAKLLAEALRCAQDSPDAGLAATLRASADAKTEAALKTLLQTRPADDSVLSGELRLEASWSGDSDLDLAILDGEGRRASWLGAPTKSIIAARDVLSTRREGLSLSRPAPGEYVIEITRASGTGRVSGELVVTIGKSTRRVPFTFDGARATVALATVRMQSRLIPL